LGGVGWFAVITTQIVGLFAFLRLLFRRAPVEEPTVFSAGQPGDYRKDSVSARYLSRWRVFVVREGDDLFAVHARCTHLGCTPRWYAREGKFKCPCHGSGFTRQGVNFEGPAPRPLERAGIALDPRGELLIDVGKRLEPDEWGKQEASVSAASTERV